MAPPKGILENRLFLQDLACTYFDVDCDHDHNNLATYDAIDQATRLLICNPEGFFSVLQLLHSHNPL